MLPLVQSRTYRSNSNINGSWHRTRMTNWLEPWDTIPAAGEAPGGGEACRLTTSSRVGVEHERRAGNLECDLGVVFFVNFDGRVQIP